MPNISLQEKQSMGETVPFPVQLFSGAKFSTRKYALMVVEGPHKGLSVQLDREFLRIGRADWCDLCLSLDRKASGVHCEISVSEQGIRVRDCNSRNGVFLANHRIFDALMTPETTLQIGDSSLQLQASDQITEIKISYQDDQGQLVGKSESMRKIFQLMKRIAKQDVHILLTGETGTGKTSLAQAIHNQSHRSQGPFVVVNCGALPANLIESALFGYEKGAFTDAKSRHKGYFEQAQGGTLFLDELGELPMDLQPKLLDVLERHKLRPLGSEREIEVDFRLITATHRNLTTDISRGAFRKDLYFRIAVIEIEVPALRERIEDIPLLAFQLLSKIAPDRALMFTEVAIQMLQHYLWPGNVRQLRNVLERAAVLCEGNTIDPDALYLPPTEEDLGTTHTPTSSSWTPNIASSQSILPPLSALSPENTIPLKDVMASLEKTIISHALEVTDGHVGQAADLLQLSAGWLYNRIKKHGIDIQSR